jgi:hypothetical protein
MLFALNHYDIKFPNVEINIICSVRIELRIGIIHLFTSISSIVAGVCGREADCAYRKLLKHICACVGRGAEGWPTSMGLQ